MKKTVLLAMLILAAGTPMRAESDFDLFFKNNDDYADVLITEVRSAHHFTIKNAHNEKEIIRLIGLKAPEAPRHKKVDTEYDSYGFPVKPDVDVEVPLEEKAYNFARELLDGKHVRLEFDSTKKNDEDQTLAYVFLIDDGTFVNAEILRQGFAHLQIRPPNTKYSKELRAAYQEARREKRGLQGL
ncbi:MAG: thermonuclease family protein [Candidatus Omnitrophica bacterium]|nr:thermonuclease family protein [Candidatus Omnitrophota bacterium]